jgi:hypothetical protein
MFRNQNFLKRKDASCKTDWSPAGSAKGRKITVEELYGATEDCQQQFYQGCLKDFRNQNKRFRDFIMKSFRGGIGLDLAANSYFGNVKRAEDNNPDPTKRWSWNKYDGIFTKIAEYTADGTIAGGQHFAIDAGVINPADAYDIMKDLYDRQDDVLDGLVELDKAIYVDKKLAKAYERYLISIGVLSGGNEGVGFIRNGIPTLNFEGIPIYIEPVWNPILKKLNGGANDAHAAVLTVSKNFVFGTNKNYGGGPDEDMALRVWWSDDDEVWRQKMYMCAGTELIMPQHIVYGITDNLA